MGVATLVTLGVTATLALVGYWLTYRNNVRLAQRNARLDRVNRQLSEFYGPLFASSAAAQIAWQGFRSRFPSRKGAFWAGKTPPSPDEAAAWRLWMTEVFMPLNLRMESVVVEKSDLLDESEMPESLLQLCAHVEAYKTVLRQWEAGDFAEHTSVINYPYEVREYAQRSFADLKAEQRRLLGSLGGKG
jgi:hypothetical protein